MVPLKMALWKTDGVRRCHFRRRGYYLLCLAFNSFFLVSIQFETRNWNSSILVRTSLVFCKGRTLWMDVSKFLYFWFLFCATIKANRKGKQKRRKTNQTRALKQAGCGLWGDQIQRLKACVVLCRKTDEHKENRKFIYKSPIRSCFVFVSKICILELLLRDWIVNNPSFNG